MGTDKKRDEAKVKRLIVEWNVSHLSAWLEDLEQGNTREYTVPLPKNGKQDVEDLHMTFDTEAGSLWFGISTKDPDWQDARVSVTMGKRAVRPTRVLFPGQCLCVMDRVVDPIRRKMGATTWTICIESLSA